MDIEYLDQISVTVFKVAAGQTVTHACVSSLHPAAEESSPVDRVQPPAHTEGKASHAGLLTHANMSH